MADDLVYKARVDTTQAKKALNDLDKQVDTLSKSFGSLRNILGGIALGAFISNLYRSASAVQDLSEQTGFAVQSILGISEAFENNASSAEQAQQAISKLTQNIGEAKNGNTELIQSFREVGVSFKELFGDPEQIFKKVIKGLGGITNASDRARLSADLVGKGIKANFAGIGRTQDSYIASNAEAARATIAAERAAQNFQNAVTQIQKALLLVLDPLSKFIADVKLSANAIQEFVKAAAAIALIIGTFTAVGKAIALLRTGFGLLTGAGRAVVAGVNVIIETFKGLGKTAQITWHYISRALGLKDVKNPRTGIIEGLRKQFGFLAKDTKTLAEEFPKLAKALAIFGSVGASVVAIFDSDKILSFFRKIGETFGLVKSEAESMAEYIDEINNKALERWQKEQDAAAEAAEAEKQYLEAQANVVADKIRNINKLVTAYQEGFADIVSGIRDEIDQITLSPQANTLKKNLKSVEDVYEETKRKLQEELDVFKTKPQNKITIFDEQQIAKIKQELKNLDEAYRKATEDATAATLDLIVAEDNQQRKIIENRIALEEYQDQLSNNEALQELKDEASLIGLTGKELKIRTEMLKIEGAVRQAVNTELVKQKDLQLQLNDAIQKGNTLEADRLKLEIEASKRKIDAIKTTGNEQKKQTEKNIEDDAKYNESVIDRLLKRIRDTKDELAKYNLGDTLFDSLDKAINDFVETGKFKFKEFAAAALREWLAMKAKMALMDVFDGLLSKVKDIFGGITGGSSGGSKGFLGNLFGNILKSFLPGFANGGVPPMNKPSIVGERGPELFVPRQTGTVVPSEMLAAMSRPAAPVTNNYITNNINALDAKSVAQLFAENRKSLLGSVRTAEKELPYRA